MLKQLLGEIDGFGKSSVDGLHSLFESQMNDLTMRAQNYKEQITNPSSYFYATPSFKVGAKGQLHSNKKPFPFSFNSGSAKKTPLKSPPIILHKTPIISPHSFRKQQTPLVTRNFDQELNIQAHNVTISHSPLFKFVKSPTLMTSGGNKKKRKSSSVSKRNQVELPKEIEVYAPIPPLEFDKDLGIDKDDMDTDPIKPAEQALNKKNSVMSVDTELDDVNNQSSPLKENNKSTVSIPPQIATTQQIQSEAPLQPVVIPPTIFQLPKVKEEPISDEEEIVVKKNRQPKRKPNPKPQPIQEPPKEPEIIVIDDAKSDVTEQLSCLLISEALKENEKKEEQSDVYNSQPFIIKQEIVDSPELVNNTFNRTCFDEMNISVINPVEEERKQTEFSFLSKTKLFQETNNDDLSDDSILCFSASDDDLFEDEKEEDEKDVCVKINFSAPVINLFENKISNPFSNLKKSNSVEAVKVSSLQEKIKSLKTESSFPSIQSILPKVGERPSLELSEPPCTPTRTPSLSGAIEKLGQLSIHNNKVEVMFSSPEVELSPPPFDSISDFSSPKYSSLQHINTEVSTPKQEPPLEDKNSTTPKNDMQLSTPPTVAAFKEPPTVSQHGKYKPFTPKFMEQKPISLSSDAVYEDPFATLKRDSIDIIDVEENDHKRKFNNKVSIESNDQKRLKLSDTNRISISSVSSVSSISSFHSNASMGEASNPGVGNVVSNIFTGVKSFVFKVAQNKNKSNVGTSKKAISSLKLAEAAKKKEEEKKNAKKEKLEKQLSLQKKKKEQEEKLKEESKKPTKLVKPATNTTINTSQKSVVEGLALASGSRCSNTSTCSTNNTAQPSKKQIGPMNKPPAKKQTTLTTIKPLPVPEPRVSSYELSDEYDSSEDDEVAKRRRQSKKIPSWAQGETLKKNIKRTTKIDPDRIFGTVRTCNLEDIFKGTTNQVMINRFRQRTSSSNWADDHFTLEEEQEYREEMGFNQ